MIKIKIRKIIFLILLFIFTLPVLRSFIILGSIFLDPFPSQEELDEQRQEWVENKIHDIGIDKLTKEDSVNYKNIIEDNKITITFDKFTGLTLYSVDISNYTTLYLKSTLPKGKATIKYSQGDLKNIDLWGPISSSIYEEDLSSTVETFSNNSLEHLDKNKPLDIWIVGDNALNGSIYIELYNE